MSDPRVVVTEFRESCAWAWIAYRQYQKLFEHSKTRLDLFERSAKNFFGDLNRIFIEYVLLQICRLTDAAQTFGHDNLTTNYILHSLSWPAEIRTRLEPLATRINAFRAVIDVARKKGIAHADLGVQIRGETLGAFPQEDGERFWRDLQEFLNIAHEHYVGGPYPFTEMAMQFDADDLVVALKKAVDYDDLFVDRVIEKMARLRNSPFHRA